MNVRSVLGLPLAALVSACATPMPTMMDAGFDAADVIAVMESGATDRPDVRDDAVTDVPSVMDVPNVNADTGVCAMGTMACGTAGCVDPQTDINHCGTCGNACPPGLVCSAGACVVVCRAPLERCSGACIDTMNNPAHCGACGNQCVAENATPVCVAGRCNLICAPNFSNCDDNLANGCESNTTNSAAHCGRCGNACPMGQRCAANVCGLDCPMPNTICGAGAMMTCANLQTDVTHCGTCGNACSASNGTAGCVAGACTVTSCDAGFGDCDGNAANGCETNINTNASHCAACGIRCPPPSSCFDGECRL